MVKHVTDNDETLGPIPSAPTFCYTILMTQHNLPTDKPYMKGTPGKDFRSTKREALNVPASKLPLVEERHPDDFRSSFHWRIFRIMAEFVDGWTFLADFKKIVTFFGSARFKEGDQWYDEARKLAHMLANVGFDIVTGGGPGIMEAANQGAHEVHEHNGSLLENDKKVGDSVGLNIKLPFEQRINAFVDKAVAFHYFFVRKVMLSYYAQVYIFFPGGFGTLDEVFEIITLIQTKKITAHVPVILVGKDFWTPLIQWINDGVYDQYRAIDKEDLSIFTIVDNAEEAFKIIKHTPERKEF